MSIKPSASTCAVSMGTTLAVLIIIASCSIMISQTKSSKTKQIQTTYSGPQKCLTTPGHMAHAQLELAALKALPTSHATSLKKLLDTLLKPITNGSTPKEKSTTDSQNILICLVDQALPNTGSKNTKETSSQTTSLSSTRKNTQFHVTTTHTTNSYTPTTIKKSSKTERKKEKKTSTIQHQNVLPFARKSNTKNMNSYKGTK